MDGLWEGCYLKIGTCRGLSISCVSRWCVCGEKEKRKVRAAATAKTEKGVSREDAFLTTPVLSAQLVRVLVSLNALRNRSNYSSHERELHISYTRVYSHTNYFPGKIERLVITLRPSRARSIAEVNCISE